ncbi:endonuclease/exonuclease/phosphatase family protein [Patulibacter minatonensis]|uniref:endonuclease/exonuclease/phosphatase family protein n=1 Tax=Patulibacter minatonensis TaxID=298163 RepID=UPI0012F91D9C|nr:endonuclease/exonuclease/phosphatase family protein [Patulibacter minatonensis]
MTTSSPARTLRRVAAAFALASALAPVVAASPASAAGRFTPLIHLNACDRAQKCENKRGTATGSIIATVKARKPDLLTLNEICSKSVRTIAKETGYHHVFTQAGPKSVCRGGRGNRGEYGNAILAAPQRTLTSPYRYAYAAQAKGNPEKRLLTCADSSGALVCTTHLDPTGVKRAQAKELRAQLDALLVNRNPLMFVGADLNLDPEPAAQFAKPDALQDFNDGRVMHIFASKSFANVTRTILTGAEVWTDHPGLQLLAPLP